MYGDLETYDEVWFAIVPQYLPDWFEGDYDEEEDIEYCPEHSKQNARTVRISKLSTGSPQK